MNTHTYGSHFDAHLAPWLKARFGLTVEWSPAVPSAQFGCYRGDLDYDTPYGYGRDVMGAALDYCSGYDGALCDVLDDICAGIWY